MHHDAFDCPALLPPCHLFDIQLRIPIRAVQLQFMMGQHAALGQQYRSNVVIHESLDAIHSSDD